MLSIKTRIHVYQYEMWSVSVYQNYDNNDDKNNDGNYDDGYMIYQSYLYKNTSTRKNYRHTENS